MKKIIKVKGMCFGPGECADRIAPAGRSNGLLAKAFCGLRLNAKCPNGQRRTVEVAPIGVIDGLPVIAAGPVALGADMNAHIKIAAAYDVIPYLHRHELALAYKFACDYSGRGIEWALVARGEYFSLYKRATRSLSPPSRRK